jgi:hypothetical protein
MIDRAADTYSDKQAQDAADNHRRNRDTFLFGKLTKHL